MAIKPILFNTEMVRAILDRRKVCTRRIIKPQPTGEYATILAEIAPYQPGDILYVRETFAWCPCWDCRFDTIPNGCRHPVIYDSKKREHGCYMYRASCEDNEYPSADTWHPSIHMPKEVARIWLKVTDVRVERLQSITEGGAIREGAEGEKCHHTNTGAFGCTDCMNTGWIEPPQVEFMQIWNSTIKKSDLDRYGWDANPWVWVIEFERCEKPEGV